MPITKLSTSNDDYEALLLELLAVIHRDGGHYTTLAGLMTSLETAHYTVNELYRKNAALTARIGQLSRGER
jgi:hypothetical protein